MSDYYCKKRNVKKKTVRKWEKKPSNPTAQNNPCSHLVDIGPGFQNKKIDGLRAENWESEGHGCKQDFSQ